MSANKPDVIALIRCNFRNPEMDARYQPSWVRLLDGERVLTTHQADAWVTDVECAEEIAADCNGDPEWQTITWNAGNFQFAPVPVVYSVVVYKEVKHQKSKASK